MIILLKWVYYQSCRNCIIHSSNIRPLKMYSKMIVEKDLLSFSFWSRDDSQIFLPMWVCVGLLEVRIVFKPKLIFLIRLLEGFVVWSENRFYMNQLHYKQSRFCFLLFFLWVGMLINLYLILKYFIEQSKYRVKGIIKLILAYRTFHTSVLQGICILNMKVFMILTEVTK